MILLENCFYIVLDQSWKVAAVVLVILAIRRIFGKRLSPAVRHALWIFVALAALTPGPLLPRPTIWLPAEYPIAAVESTPDRFWGNHPTLSGTPPKEGNHSLPSEGGHFAQQNGREVISTTTAPSTLQAMKDHSVLSGTPPLEGNDVAGTGGSSPVWDFPWLTLFVTLWCCGFAAMLTLSVTQMILFRRKLACATPVLCNEILAVLEMCRIRMGVARAVPLVESDRLAAPILLGLLRPRIILPGTLVRSCTPEQLEYFFLHELAHLRRHDILCGWVMSLLCFVHWYNPLLWVAVGKMNDDAEEATDQLALSRLPSKQHARYGKTLVSIAEQINPTDLPVQIPGNMGIMESSSQLTRRIEMITQKNHWKHRWILLAVGLCLLVSVATLTRFRPVEAEAPKEPGMERSAVPGQEAVISPETTSSETADDRQQAPDDEENADAIPDGTALQLLQYVNRQLGGGMGVPDNDTERKALVEKLERSLTAINLGLDRVSDDDVILQPDDPREPRKSVRTELLYKKVFALWLLNEYAKGYTAMYMDFITELEGNPADRTVAKMARARYLSDLGSNMAFRKNVPITKDKFLEYQKQVQEFLQDDGDNYIQSMALYLIHAAIRLADQENDRTIATETAALCTTLFENAKDEFNRSLAYRPAAIVNKYYLAVDGMQIQGKLFDGETFDIADYRGKPMLVVFWRSDPQVEENLFSPAHASNLVFPKLKEIYEQYHDRGLEIVGVCTDRTREELPAPEDLFAMLEHSFKTAESLPWRHNISEKRTLDAGLPSNEKKYDLFGEYIFFLDAEGRILHQQSPDCADFDSANAMGINITGMAHGARKYLTEKLEQKIKDYFSGIEVQFYLGQREIQDGREKITGETQDDVYTVEGDTRFAALKIVNRSGRDMHNVELVIHAPSTTVYRVSDAVKTIIPESSGIEKSGDAYRLKVGTLPSEQEATMILEFEICFTDRYLPTKAEVLEDGERYGSYEMLLQVKQTDANQ